MILLTTMANFLNKKLFLGILVLSLTLLISVYFLFVNNSKDNSVFLSDYNVILDLQSFKKDSISNIDSVNLNTIVRYNFNSLLQKEPLDSLLFEKMNYLVQKETNHSKKKIIELLNVLRLKRENKLDSSKNLLSLLEYFEANKDKTAQIHIYSSLYFLNSTQKGIEKGNEKLANYYSNKIISIANKSRNKLDKLIANAHFIIKKIRTSNLSDEKIILDKLKDSDLIINKNPDYIFLKSEIYLAVSYWYFNLGQFRQAKELNNKVMVFSNSNMEKSTAAYYNAVNLFFESNFEESLKKLKLADSLYISSKEKNLTVDLYHNDLLINIYLKTNKSEDNIVEVLLKKDSLKTLLDKQEDVKTIQELQSKYNFEKNENEIKEQNLKLNFLVVIVILFTTLIVFLIYYFNKYKRINFKLKEELKLKEDIQRVISHDILSPIIALEGMVKKKMSLVNVNVNEKVVYSDEYLNKQLNYILNTKILCQNLIEWLWTKSVKKDSFTFDFIKLFLEEIISSISHYVELNNSKIELKDSQTNSEFTYEIDKNALAVVVRNIVYNIIKHSKADTINISLIENQNQLKIIFSDNGIPIGENEINEINEYLKDPKSFKKYNGLGLYLIKSFINKNDYKIVVSTAQGEYSNKLELIIVNRV